MSGSLRRSVSMLLQTKGKRDNRHFITIKTLRIMANRASTSYVIEGSKAEVSKVYQVIDDFMSGRKQPVAETASDDWEGNIVKTLGATDEQMKKYLRGFIQWFDFDGCVLRIDAEEAWGATDFYEVLGELMPNLTIYFSVEEPGCEIYATNDADGKYFADRFYVESAVNNNYAHEYFTEKKDAMSYVAELLGRENVSKEELDKWNEEQEDYDAYIYVHEYKVVA